MCIRDRVFPYSLHKTIQFIAYFNEPFSICFSYHFRSPSIARPLLIFHAVRANSSVLYRFTVRPGHDVSEHRGTNSFTLYSMQMCPLGYFVSRTICAPFGISFLLLAYSILPVSYTHLLILYLRSDSWIICSSS